MPRIKTESKTPILRTPAPGARGSTGGSGRGGWRGGRGGSGNNGDGGPNNGSNRGRRSGGVHPAMMLSNKKMEEILHCDDVNLDILKHATYKIMKDEPTIKRQDLRTRLAAQEPEFQSMLSGARWEGRDYPENRTFEEDLGMLLIKIMSIARQKLKREAKKMELKQEQGDEGYATTSPPKSLSPTARDYPRVPQLSPSKNLSSTSRNRRASNNAGVEPEENFLMSGGAGNSDDVVAPTGVRPTIEGADDQEEDQRPSGGLAGSDNVSDARHGALQNILPGSYLRHSASMRPAQEEEEDSEAILGTPTLWRRSRERMGRNRLTVRRQDTRAFGVQDVVELD